MAKSTKKKIEKEIRKHLKPQHMILLFVLCVICFIVYVYVIEPKLSTNNDNSDNNNGDNTELADLEINFMMLGNKYAGDSIYIKAGDTDILVDAGSRKNSAPVIKDYLFDSTSNLHSYIEDNKLEYVIATHADQDT